MRLATKPSRNISRPLLSREQGRHIPLARQQSRPDSSGADSDLSGVVLRFLGESYFEPVGG